MAKVNPPPHSRLSLPLLTNPRAFLKFLQDQAFILFQLYNRTGGSTDLVELANEFRPGSNAQINQIREQIGSGDFLTADDTGFTADNDKFTADMSEA